MVEDLLAAGVKKEDLPKKPMHWTKRKKPWDEEEEDLEVLNAKGGICPARNRSLAMDANDEEGSIEWVCMECT